MNSSIKVLAEGLKASLKRSQQLKIEKLKERNKMPIGLTLATKETVKQKPALPPSYIVEVQEAEKRLASIEDKATRDTAYEDFAKSLMVERNGQSGIQVTLFVPMPEEEQIGQVKQSLILGKLEETELPFAYEGSQFFLLASLRARVEKKESDGNSNASNNSEASDEDETA